MISLKDDVLFEVETDILSDITSKHEGFFTEAKVENFYDFGETIAKIFDSQDQIKEITTKVKKNNKDQENEKKFFSNLAYEKALKLKINPKKLVKEIDTFITTDILEEYLSNNKFEIKPDINTLNTLHLSKKFNISTSASFNFSSKLINFQKNSFKYIFH